MEESRDLETSVCGRIREPLTFAMWSHLAGTPDPERARRIPNAEAIAFTTGDGRILSGYKLGSTAAGGRVVGRLLVAQGNAMLADQLLSSLVDFSDAGLEVYIFDYRGYGHSEGRPRLRAIVSDYEELAGRLAAAPTGKRLFYGISFGGIVLLNVIGRGAGFDAAVIDSAPSRIAGFGCPERYDPVANLPSDASRVLIVAGGEDTVVPPRDSEELVERTRALGGRAEVRSDYAHPFMDRDEAVHRSRLDRVRSFLLE